MEYMEWKKRLTDKTCEKVLKTIEHILDDADKWLSDAELDELKDCYKILNHLQEVR